MELIEKYFGGELTPLQRERFVRLYDLYAEWNARINVVSRKDFDSLYLKHVLHSLAIACACRFDGGAQVCDVGTGGGFPAVPLAIFLPGAHFTAVDSIGKKITVVRAVASALGLPVVAPNSPPSPPRLLSSSASSPKISLTNAPAPTALEYALQTVMIFLISYGGIPAPIAP